MNLQFLWQFSQAKENFYTLSLGLQIVLKMQEILFSKLF